MAGNKLDSRQTEHRAALSNVGSAANETLDSILTKTDSTLGTLQGEASKLFEDRNVQLTDGGLISFLGTTVQFSQSLKLHINSKIVGSTPVIIDLGSSTRSVSADGRMIYAVINRTAGTATVTADATSLPAVNLANQEVFLIAKRVDSPDGVKRLYFRNGSAFNEGQSARLGSAGSGSSSGIGDDLNSLTFKASIYDTFSELSTDILSTIDYSAGKTDTNVLSLVNQYARLNYDASKTVIAGTTTTNLNISAVAAFTVKVGDFAVYADEMRRITAVATQASFTVEAFSTAPILAGQVTISQGVYTKDLNNFSGDGLAPSVAFSTTINQILVNYEDSTTNSDTIFDANTTPVIAYSASSSNGTSYTGLKTRSTNLSDSMSMTDLPSTGTSLYLRFVANKTSGSGSVNLLNYKVFFHRELAYQDGVLQNQSYCLTNGAGVEINCLAPVVTAGKTRIQTTWSYPLAVNSGLPDGALVVYLNGQKIPRYVDATLTPDAYYKEISPNLIELDSDYSAVSLSVQILQTSAVIDASDTNTSNISQLQEIQSQGFQDFVSTSATLSATSIAGTPAIGNFYSTISNRAIIVDITQNLKAAMGIERIMTQSIYQLQNEFGPNGEPVFAAVNDSVGSIRFVGGWGNTATNTYGSFIQASGNLTDYVEITFYGTGLNLIAYGFTGYDVRVSVDGGSEGSNIFQSAYSAVLGIRNYAVNNAINIASGLTLGVHTAKIRNNNASSGFVAYGFEILNSSTTLTVNPGSSYIAGKKISTIAQQSLAYNSTFESGTLGTRGGRVTVYQKADGTIAKAVQPVNAAAAYAASADHTNEEIARTYFPREFGAGRVDDFSLIPMATAQAASFTLDDGTTSLAATSTQFQTVGGGLGLNISSANGGSMTFTFIGTGIDISLYDTFAGGGADNYTFRIDGGIAQPWPYSTGNTSVRNVKFASGLPYGTHQLTLTRVTAVTYVPSIVKFIVYQPKKVAAPAGTIELADYNVMADYVANTAGTVVVSSPGTLYKSEMRELVYVGTWTAGINTGSIDGWRTTSSISGNSVQYTFFGTGAEVYAGGNGTTAVTLSVNGLTLNTTNYPSVSVIAPAANGTWTASTGIWSAITGSAQLQITGLPLGVHTIKLTKNDVAQLSLYGFGVITPIHSAKSNLSYDQQNTLPVGSSAISDNRKTSAIKELAVQTKNISQAVGITSGPTTTSTVAIPMPDMSVTHFNRSGRIKISYSTAMRNSLGNGEVYNVIVLDGNAVSTPKEYQAYVATSNGTINDCIYLNVSPGYHKIDVYWWANIGTTTAIFVNRNLLVEEI